MVQAEHGKRRFFSHLQFGGIALPYAAHRLFQRSDREDGLLALDPGPVFPELGPVLAGPFEKQAHCAPWEPARLNFQRLQQNDDFIFGIACMEVRWLVVVPIHRNDDAEESAKRGHAWDAFGAILGTDLRAVCR